ncbi:NAD-dependent epimerase/dehydratase family protein [Aliikangiella marina]|nr:NAD-dependent epimerase/dehydratase family protein [Aliikangiella marina]
MPFTRRHFLATTLSSLSLSFMPQVALGGISPAPKKLKILFLGGTGYLGPHTVNYAIARGHEVTLFNRGKTNTDLFPMLRKIKGNRDPKIDRGLTHLKSGEWDAVIDTSGFVPRIVNASASLLADRVKHYLFISTLCVYDQWAASGLDNTENRKLIPFNSQIGEDVAKHYCELKAYSENAINAVMPNRVTNIRPGFIVGPRDKKNRFYYWPTRIERGGDVIALGKPNDLTQFIDVRDLAKFIIHCLETKLTGDYNLVAPQLSFGHFLNTCNQVTGNKAKLHWIPHEYLAKHQIYPWQDLPMWAAKNASDAGMVSWSSQKALDDGLTIRPLEETIRDTLDWYHTLSDAERMKLKTSMTDKKEKTALNAWKNDNL